MSRDQESDRARLADEREQVADAREAAADAREAALDAREAALDAKEHALLRRTGHLLDPKSLADERAFQEEVLDRTEATLARAGERVARSRGRIHREGAAQERVDAHAVEEQAEIDAEVLTTRGLMSDARENDARESDVGEREAGADR